MKTSELTDPALDWAVAKCEWLTLKKFERKDPWYYAEADGVYRFIVGHTYSPSTDWAQGGPIIERENLQITTERGGGWVSSIPRAVEIGGYRKYIFTYGPTPLIAAMRCYVASKLGDEVEVPADFED